MCMILKLPEPDRTLVFSDKRPIPNPLLHYLDNDRLHFRRRIYYPHVVLAHGDNIGGLSFQFHQKYNLGGFFWRRPDAVPIYSSS